MLQKMDDFFESRLDIHDEHMLNDIECSKEFYLFTASRLPSSPNAYVLDLGCGTGLELKEYFTINPTAKVIGIDLSRKMLDVLNKKFPDKDINLICGSYFDIDFGENKFDAVVSVESLHHFISEDKISLYKKVYSALKDKKRFVITDYYASSEEEEVKNFDELKLIKDNQGITDNDFYHYDTPLTIEHEMQILKIAGFTSVSLLKTWGDNSTIEAIK